MEQRIVDQGIDQQLVADLAPFLPTRVFDAHAHFYDSAFLPTYYDPDGTMFTQPRLDGADHRRFLESLFPRLELSRANIVTMPDPAMADRDGGLRDASVRFLAGQLDQFAEHVGEVLVLPGDSDDDIEAMLVHPSIRGFKCYHVMSAEKPTWQAGIESYLPESAWRVAHARGFCITLHMVRDRALSDPENRDYIIRMARRYPRATLILAHAARGFAAWTTVRSVAELAPLENVWFDLSAICESPPMIAILRRCGVKRVLWGSDYPVSTARGKAISLGDGFYWIYDQDIERFAAATSVRATRIGIENLLAVREACELLDLDNQDVADIFYDNAMRLFGLND